MLPAKDRWTRPVGSLEAWRFAMEEGASAALAMDHAAREAPSRSAWQCASACNACCHLMVLVTAREVDEILPRVTLEIAARMRANAAAVRGMDAGAYRRARRRCAFLDAEGRCAAYDVRPIRCRAHVSSDVGVCHQVLEGELPAGAVPGDGWLRSVATAVQHGLGGPTEELHAALAARLTAQTPPAPPKCR